MALKGFLASGFQKLIGASRILGANNRYVGEQNTQAYTGGFPITTTLNDGFNIIRWVPTTNQTYITSTLFSANPTSPTQVVLNNRSAYSIKLNNVIGTGGLLLTTSTADIRNGQSIVLVYDLTNNYWVEVCRSSLGQDPLNYSLANGMTTIAMQSYAPQQTFIIGSAATTNLTISKIVYSSAGNSFPPGIMVTIIGAHNLDMTYQTTFQQLVSTPDISSYENLILNGDFVLTRNATLTLQSTTVGWVEVSRTNPTY